MRNLIKAENLKLQHMFGGKISFIAPCTMLLLALVLTGGLGTLSQQELGIGGIHYFFLEHYQLLAI